MNKSYITVAALATIYMLSQFLRNSVAVIAPNLAQEFQLDAAALSLLASGFFLAFACAQIPLGLAIDRFGPKKPMILTALLAIAGLLSFSWARHPQDLTIARFVMGLGCCSFFMAPLALYARLFSKHQFSAVASLHLGFGSLGMLAASAPLATASAAFGWRNVFLGVAAFAVLALLGLIFFVREPPSPAAASARKESFGEICAGLNAAMRVNGFWRLFFMQFAASGAFIAIVSLWIGPWLAQVYNMPLEARGRLTFFMAIAQILAIFAWGPTDRWLRSYRKPVLIGAALSVLALAFGALTTIPETLLPFYVIVFAAALAFFPPLVAHGKALFPDHLVGRGLTLLNMGTMGGGFVLQSVTGLAMEAFDVTIVDGARTYPPQAFQATFAILAAQLALAAWFYRTAPDPRINFGFGD